MKMPRLMKYRSLIMTQAIIIKGAGPRQADN